jgi:hypothetical protein
MGPALSTRSCTALTHVGAFHAETDQQHGEAAGGDECRVATAPNALR